MSECKIRYALTQPQQRVWYTEKLYPGTGMWNNAGTLKIRGKLDYSLLKESLNLFIKENESVRLKVGLDGEDPYQYISEFEERNFDVFDFSARGVEQLYEWDSMQTQAPMPLIESDLYYFALVKITEKEGGIYVKFHHIISDGLSIVEFANQVMNNYERLLGGKEMTPTPTRSYVEYIKAEEEYLNSKRFVYDKKYWMGMFEELPEPTVIKQKKTNYFSVKAKRKVSVIDNELSGKIRSYCYENSVSPFSLFLSALAIYINRISGKDDIIIGAPVANRTSKTAKGAFGMFVSTVPIRIKIQDDLTFTDFAQEVSGKWFAALKHQRYPYNMLVHDLRKKHKGLENLYDVTLSYQIGTFEKDVEQFTYEGRWHFSRYQATSLNIHVNDREAQGKLIIDYDHHVPFFSSKEIDYFHAHLINIVKDIISKSDKKLYNLELLADEERDRILYRFNDTDSRFPDNETFVGMWQKCMSWVSNDKTAIVFKDKSMTYGELDARSTAFALHLKKQGCGAEDIVGLLIKRTPDYFVSMLGVLKAGAAFLPIDTQLPEERISYMLSDSCSKAVIASPDMIESCASLNIPVISTATPLALPAKPNMKCACKPENLAYVIYTSGSTGQPKGVQIEHRSISHFMHMMRESWDYSPGAKMLCAASFCFDMSIMEAMPALVFGAEIILAAEDEVNIPRNMVRLIKNTHANIMMVTPGRMELLLSDPHGAACLREFRDIGLGGDVLPEKLLAKVQMCTNARITNFYGPTEITVCATCTDVTHAKVPNIGSPMQDVKAYILDSHQNPVPIGVAGELYVGGKGVSRGYINKPDLNKERFIDNPRSPGMRLYRTGDLARWYPLGEIEFLGRIDKQVKIRGYRIELAEIENRLLQIQGINSCVVADYSDASDRKFLAAFVCGQPPATPDIKASLQKVLPTYMIPSYFVTLDKLPFNASGKVDKTKLPDPLEGAEIERDEVVPPRTRTEKELAEIWKSVLGIEQIDRSDSFFDIGGDSLSIVMVMSRIPQKFYVEIMLEDVYKNPQLKEFAAIIDAAEQCVHQPITKAKHHEDYPVSSAQQRMWILQQSDENSIAYNIPMVLVIDSKPDVDKLRSAFYALIKRHEAFRTVFNIREGKLRQKILDKVNFDIGQHRCMFSELDDKIKSLMKPFDMSSAPLLRVNFIETDEKFVLFIDVHHSISDRRSTEIILDDLVALYEGRPLVDKQFEYKDYSVWQQDYYSSEGMRMQKEYWQGMLSGELPLLNLHTDMPRAAVQQYNGKRLMFDVSKDVSDRLRKFAAKRGNTLFNVVLAVYNVLLSKYTGQDDIIIGTPALGRSRHEASDIVGVFINTLPLRGNPRGDISFAQFFEEISHNTISAIANCDYPLEKIISDISLPRDASRNPLFDTMLVHSSMPQEFMLGDTSCSFYPFDPGIAKLDLTLEVYDSKDELKCLFEYNTDLFKERTMRQISRHLTRLFDILTDEPDTRIRDVAMLTQDEVWQVTRGFNQTDKPLPKESVQALLEKQAKTQPNKTALICNKQRMTFYELNNRANQIAHVLRKNKVGRNTIVALNLCRSFDMIAGLFAILKAGGGYLPLDTMYPKDRLEFMLSDSETEILLTDGTTDLMFSGKTINVAEIEDTGKAKNLPRIDSNEDTAYVIYTSGSTGMPKGAALSRLGMYNLYESVKSSIEYDINQTCISVTTVSFDIFVTDCVMPLICGCTVALCTEEELRQPHLTAELVEYAKVGFIQTTPTRMSIMIDDKRFKKAAVEHFRKIVLAGEMIPMSLLTELQEDTNAKIINGYGPTETTVYSSFKDLTNAKSVTIGRPAANTHMYILDYNKRPLPIGVLGELYISGSGVSAGYINRKELTKERFMPDPYWPGHMMYKTGDVCAFMEDGDIEICGRVDHQIKIRGLRIELGEIEAAIRAFEGIEDAVVRDWGEGVNKYLCAYYACYNAVDERELRRTLSQNLPAYMVPSFFTKMGALPTTLNGKVDRKALMEPQKQKRKNTSSVDVTYMSADERKMGRIWSDILNIRGIGPDDNFFELGGDSLAVINVQAALLQYGWTISTKDFYSAQTLRRVCGYINSESVEEADATIKNRLNISIPEFKHLMPININRVLLTGATGFLGAHLLYKLSMHKKTHIHCLVRGKDCADSAKRLIDCLVFYFGAKVSKQIMSSVSVHCGDVSCEKLGLSNTELKLLNIDTVIHSAAITDHMGLVDAFEKTNVIGTKNVTELAVSLGVSLIHVSTTGVSGTHYVEKGYHNGIFDENSYYVGQNYTDNVYIKSKFQAEEIVIEALEKGLNARIMRIGMLTATQNGTFQKQFERNAFANRIKAICELGYVPIGMLGTKIEMTPVDACTEAMLALMDIKEPYISIHHVFNTNTMTLAVLISLLEQNGNRIEIISDDAFMKKVAELSKRGDYKNLISLMEDFSSERKMPQIEMTAKRTMQQLSSCGFSWPVIDKEYMGSFLNSFSDSLSQGDKEA